MSYQGIKRLSDSKIRSFKPRKKVYRVSDGNSLYLEIATSGSKLWRFRYKKNNKETMIKLGMYPYVTLAEARTEANNLKKKLARNESLKKNSRLFKDLFFEWINKKKAELAKKTLERKQVIAERDLLPHIGNLNISDIDAPILIDCLTKIEKRSLETAKKGKEICKGVFDYAIALGLVKYNPTMMINAAMTPNPDKNYPTITDPKKVGDLLNKIDNYKGDFRTRYGLKLLMHTFLRPGELRGGRWDEINFETKQWIVPAERMKRGREHIVPLSNQAISMLNDLYYITGRTEFIFPSRRYRMNKSHISANTLIRGLRVMRYKKDEIVPHGFRQTASTLLNENGFDPHIVEKQLSHETQNKVARAYNKAEYINQRTEMMQWWSNYLDKLLNE